MQIILLAKDSVGKTIFILFFNFADYLAHTTYSTPFNYRLDRSMDISQKWLWGI